jgi:hypothetical protein
MIRTAWILLAIIVGSIAIVQFTTVIDRDNMDWSFR